jgi:hypothetical protein
VAQTPKRPNQAATDNDPQLPVFARFYVIILTWYSVRVVSDLRRWAKQNEIIPESRMYCWPDYRNLRLLGAQNERIRP